MRATICTLLAGAGFGALSVGCAYAQQAQPSGDSAVGVGEIVVTAQKREQALNSVGMSIAAATAETLQERGVTSPADLVRIVPGFSFTQSPYSTPVYTLRGIGLYDYSLGSSPSVAVYQDQFSIPFPTMTVGLGLDLQRLETLKGPQGTLFGSSSTGGAINYIANKPTDTFEAGLNLSYERFGRIDASGFVSGPIAPNLNGRFALRAVEGGEWQYSATRPEDENGATRQLIGRVMLDWEAANNLRFELMVNGYHDRSDTQQAQFISNQLNIVPSAGYIPPGGTRSNPYEVVDPAAYAAFSDPSSPNYDPSLPGRQATVFGRLDEPGTQAYLGAAAIGLGGNARVAEWSPDYPHEMDDTFYQIALRADLDLTDRLTLTSLTSYIDHDVDRYFDNDATTAAALNEHLFGAVEFYSQELRLAYDTDRVHLIGGFNYDHSQVDDTLNFTAPDLSVSEALPGLRFTDTEHNLRQEIENIAVFANADFEIIDNLTVQLGARWTNSQREGSFCSFDPTAAQPFSKTFGNADVVPGFGFYDLQTAFGLDPAGHVVINPGECYPLNDTVAPTDPDYLRPQISRLQRSLDEDNTSWRAAINYIFDATGTLLYANASEGYKSGVISGIGPTVQSQYEPARQERLRAYEIGLKTPLFDNRLQFNAAYFVYEYEDKQVRVRVRDPIFGLLESMVNVPESEVEGFELELIANPIEGLNMSLSGTWLDSEVTSTFSQTAAGRLVYNQAGYTGDFKGSALPFTPELSAVADAEYEWPVHNAISAFVGGTLTYHSENNATFETDVLKADDFELPSYTLLDLRAGFGADDGSWRVSAFGRNVTDELYLTTIFAGVDSLYHYTGRPATYGVSLSLRY